MNEPTLLWKIHEFYDTRKPYDNWRYRAYSTWELKLPHGLRVDDHSYVIGENEDGTWEAMIPGEPGVSKYSSEHHAKMACENHHRKVLALTERIGKIIHG